MRRPAVQCHGTHRRRVLHLLQLEIRVAMIARAVLKWYDNEGSKACVL
jgi:hypothetical protein